MALKIILFVYLLIVLFSNNVVKAKIGINWGRQSAQRLIPSQVVDLLLQNGVPEARIYNSNTDLLQAFAGSGIGLTISIFNAARQMNSLGAAQNYVQTRIAPFPNTIIRRILYGNYFGWLRPENTVGKPSIGSTLESMMHLHTALQEFGFGDKIKLTIPQPIEVLKNLTRPSEAEFRDDIKEDMGKLLRYLKDNDAPFVFEALPITYITENMLDLSFAFCDNKSTTVITDVNGFVYTNVFEFIYDSFVWALRKAGAPDVQIVVGQMGWPTDGYAGANIQNAEKFHKTLLPLVASNEGTPMHPGVPIDVYLTSLVDENKMTYINSFSRHCGIFRGNGEPKFKIDLSGQGRDIFPTRVQGTMRMPERWCVYNGARKNLTLVMKQFKEACNGSDCTSLAIGGSCSHLDFAGNVSYAFNMYFQFKFQAESACNFKGLGRVVTTNPSIGSCVFNVDVVRGLQEQLVVSIGMKYNEVSKGLISLVLLVSTLLLTLL